MLFANKSIFNSRSDRKVTIWRKFNAELKIKKFVFTIKKSRGFITGIGL